METRRMQRVIEDLDRQRVFLPQDEQVVREFFDSASKEVHSASAERLVELVHEVRKLPIDKVSYALTRRNCEFADAVETRLAVLGYPSRANRLSRTAVSPPVPFKHQTSRQIGSGMPIRLFSWRERLGGLSNAKRKTLQDSIEALEVQLTFSPPVHLIGLTLSERSDEERRKKIEKCSITLVKISELLGSFLEECQRYLKQMEPGDHRKSRTHPDPFPPEAGRMLKSVLCQVWQNDSSKSWRTSIRHAWFAMHPDRNNNESPFSAEYGPLEIPRLENRESINTDFLSDKNLIARSFGRILSAMNDLGRVQGLFESCEILDATNLKQSKIEDDRSVPFASGRASQRALISP